MSASHDFEPSSASNQEYPSDFTGPQAATSTLSSHDGPTQTTTGAFASSQADARNPHENNEPPGYVEDQRGQRPLNGSQEPILAHPNQVNQPNIRHRSQTVQFSSVPAGQAAAPLSPVDSNRLRRTGTDIFHSMSPSQRRGSTLSASGASVFGRPKRSDTVRTYYKPSQPNWEPGAEPGIDTSEEADDGKLEDFHEVG